MFSFDMEFVSGFWFLVVGVVTLLLYFAWLASKASSQPPGPPNWPIVGSLFYLSHPIYRSLGELAKKYGPIMCLRLGYLTQIVISDAEMAMEVLKTHDVDFASRPLLVGAKHISFDWNDIVLAPYGDTWHLLRKIWVTKLFTKTRLNHFELGRQEEVAYMVENITTHCQEGKLIAMKPIFLQLITNNICRMLFGKRHEQFDGFLRKNIVDFFNSMSKIGVVGGKPNISDLIPILKPFDLQGFERQLKLIRNEIESCLSNIFMEYRKGNKIVDDFTTTNFVEILLNLDEKLEDQAIMGIIGDVTGAGVDTTASTLEWALLELIHRPDIMKKAQEEIDKVVGRNRPMLESDLGNLPYLQAIIKENFRLHPAAPTAIPHLNNKNIIISNYNIPANSIVIVNLWAIGRDPKVWNKPQEFDPYRFVDSDINVRGRHYGLLPFGSGRRQCPGFDVAQLMVQYGLAVILHAFDRFPQHGVEPKDMNVMESINGFTLAPVEPLVAIAKPRLPTQVYKGFI